MALFSRKTKTEKKVEDKVSSPTVRALGTAASILMSPRITEKATAVTEGGVYVFNVHPAATKKAIHKAVEELYRVKPRKVRVVNIPSKYKMSRNQRTFGATARGRKAYVYLKKGETIELA